MRVDQANHQPLAPWSAKRRAAVPTRRARSTQPSARIRSRTSARCPPTSAARAAVHVARVRQPQPLDLQHVAEALVTSRPSRAPVR